MAPVTYGARPVPSICIIGAGFSGLLAATKVKTKLKIRDFVVFDENEEVGGVWLANTYPGCGSDAPAHLYQYSFERNPYWSEYYASRAEILEYLQNVTRKYALYENIHFLSQVKDLVWDEEISQWRVGVFHKKTQTSKEYVFNLVINGAGALRVPNIPAQFHSFKGPVFHSSRWDASICLKDKVVAIVGSGSSSTQIIPYLASRVKTLHCYQRKRAWVMPRRNFKFPTLVKWAFAHFPFILCLFYWFLFWTMEIFYPTLIIGSKLRSIAKWYGRMHLKNQVADVGMREALLPSHALGCNRVVVSSDYFPAMQSANVKLHVDPIISVGQNHIETKINGRVEIDVLILGTGFRVQEYFSPMVIVGKNEVDLLQEWIRNRPTGYLGIVSSSAPNHFGLLGPHTGLGHNSVIFMAECQMDYITQMIQEMIRLNVKVVEVKTSTEVKEMKLLNAQMKRMVWGSRSCGSWYANAEGVNTTLWPWSCVNYWKRTRTPDFSQFNFY